MYFYGGYIIGVWRQKGCGLLGIDFMTLISDFYVKDLRDVGMNGMVLFTSDLL